MIVYCQLSTNLELTISPHVALLEGQDGSLENRVTWKLLDHSHISVFKIVSVISRNAE